MLCNLIDHFTHVALQLSHQFLKLHYHSMEFKATLYFGLKSTGSSCTIGNSTPQNKTNIWHVYLRGNFPFRLNALTFMLSEISTLVKVTLKPHSLSISPGEYVIKHLLLSRGFFQEHAKQKQSRLEVSTRTAIGEQGREECLNLSL